MDFKIVTLNLKRIHLNNNRSHSRLRSNVNDD